MAMLHYCPECGIELPADAPEGLCPQCLMKVGLRSAWGVASQATTAGYSGSSGPPTPAELGKRFGELEVIELLGQGGMGAVYKARQRDLDRVVALKILPPSAGVDPAFAERFSREARALAKLSHPNIVTVHDSGCREGLYYLLMEYVDGTNLRQLMQAGQLQPKEALKIVPQVCEALQFAHDEGIVHRDIKPENILLDRKGRVKIADFGLAKLLARTGPAEHLTRPEQVMGTPHYMAPEQIEHPLDVDHRADIYSLGVVFYEMLTGQLPLGRFAKPSEKVQVDVRLDEVVLRALEREPERRYQQASEVKTHVEGLGDALSDLSDDALAQLPLQYRRALRWVAGYEYRSKRTLFGLPLVHVARGIDPATGRPRVAKGIIAIGDAFAIGGLAIGGGGAVGIIALGGGVGLGLLSFAGLAVGVLLAIGGAALGGVALGGAAVGGVAIGGAAVGYYALGGGAFGVHPLGGNAADPQAVQFFHGLLPW